MWKHSSSTIRGFYSSVYLLQSSQADRSILNKPLATYKPFLTFPSQPWKKQAQEESAEQSMIPDSRSCLQRVPIHPAEDVTDYLLLKNREYYKSCSPQEPAESPRVLETNPAVRMASVRRVWSQKRDRQAQLCPGGVFDPALPPEVCVLQVLHDDVRGHPRVH